MKKILLLFMVMMLTGCGGYTYEYKVNPNLEVEKRTFEEIIIDYGGEYAYDFDIEYDEYILFAYDDENLSVCIDSNMPEDLVTASILAVEEYDALDFISITYHLSDDPDTGYIEDCTSYEESIIMAEYDSEAEEFCSGDSLDILGCNTYWYEDDLGIYDSTIEFNTDLMDMEDLDLLEHVTLHELGHLFGLNDLYVDELEEYSIMFWAAGDLLLVDLTEYDIYNLEYMYGNIDEE